MVWSAGERICFLIADLSEILLSLFSYSYYEVNFYISMSADLPLNYIFFPALFMDLTKDMHAGIDNDDTVV